jgi:hypothetical protein
MVSLNLPGMTRLRARLRIGIEPGQGPDKGGAGAVVAARPGA